MRLNWNHIWKSDAYRRTTAIDRRMIEIRFVAARAIRAQRRFRKVNQQQLAERMGCARSTISKLEQASDDVSLDNFFRAMLVLDATDEEIANALNPADDASVRILRQRAASPGFPRPLPVPSTAELRRWGWRMWRGRR